MSQIRKKFIIGLCSIFWLLTIVSLYSISHKPFNPSFVYSVLHTIWQLSVALLIIAICGGIGDLIYKGVNISPLALFSLQVALGLGLFSVFTLVLGALICVNIYLWGVILILLAYLLRNHIFSWGRKWAILQTLWLDTNWLGKIFALLIALILFCTLIQSLAPPLKFDALVYHLAIPRLYIEIGKIVYIPTNIFWGMPQLGEMLYLYSMVVAGEESAAVLGWMVAVLAMIGILGHIWNEFGKKYSWIAIACLLSGFTFAVSPSWGYVDWFSLLFGWCFLFSITSWRVDNKITQLILAGVFAGFALGSKYTAGIVFLVGLGIILWHTINYKNSISIDIEAQQDKVLKKENKIKFAAISIMIFILTCFIVSLPWWIKNYLGVAQPFYPFIYPAGAMNEFRLDLYQSVKIWGNYLEIVLLPYQATITGHEGSPGYSASISPLLLGFGILAFYNYSSRNNTQKKLISSACLVSILSLVIWAAASRLSGLLIQTRLYFSIFPSYTVLAVTGFQALDNITVYKVRFGRLAEILILMLLGFTFIEVGRDTLRKGALEVLLDIQSEKEYLEKNLGEYVPLMNAIQNLSANSKVLMLWEPRSFYCIPRCVPDETIDRWLREQNNEWSSADSIVEKWRRQGFTHLVYYRYGAEYIQKEDKRYHSLDWQKLDQVLSILPTPINFGNVYFLYKLSP